MTDASTPESIRRMIRRLAPVIYGPTVLFALGEGAVIPLLPIFAANLGADVPTAALVASALVVGQLFGNLPAGWAVARIGERVTMAVGGVVALLGVVGLALAPNLLVLTASVFVIGLSAAAFGLARHSFMTTRVPLEFRARALSLLGGTFRLGMFVGPFIAALLIGVFGDEHATVWFFGVCLVGAVLLVLLGPDPELQVAVPRASARDPRIAEDSGEPVTGAIPTPERVGVFRTMWLHRGVLARLGIAAASLSAVRSARQVVLPLWGVSIGLDAQTIALVVGVSGAIDFALFYASGQIMDRFGRIWAVLPSMIAMGLGFIVLAFTQEFTGPVIWFIALSAFLALGNGLSSGILLTLGADLAPQHDPAPFLGAWRTLTDAGGAVTPLAVAGIIGVASITWASGLVGVVGLVGAVMFARWLPKYMPHK